MRRILVPLDGTQLAQSILPDARRLAGPDGVLILIEAAQGRRYDPETRTRSEWYALQSVRDYLEEQAAGLRAQGVKVEAHGLYMGPAPASIDDAVGIYGVDMSRVILGSVADNLIHQLHCPIVVIPAMAAETPKYTEERRETLAGV